MREYKGIGGGRVTVNSDDTLSVKVLFTKETFAISDISELTFKECSKLINGNIAIRSKASGEKHEIVFNKKGQDEFRELYDFLCGKLGRSNAIGKDALEAEEASNPNLFIFESGKVRLELDGGFVRITRSGALNAMIHGFGGTKSINIADISAVQLKAPGATSGFLQFVFKGGTETQGGVFAAMGDENTVALFAGELAKGEKVRDYVENIISGRSTHMAQPATPADEIRKYKQLLDDGIITQEEFDIKKKELLGL